MTESFNTATKHGTTNDDSASAARLLRFIRRVDISPGSVSILLDCDAFADCLSMDPDRIREDALRIHAPFRLRRRGVVLALFAVGDVYASLCKKGTYAPFSAKQRSRTLFWL